MAGYKETPRQKMIGMLYLVLTAMLALNVSKDILDAFLVVNEATVSTNERFVSKVASTYNRFENQYSLNPGKVGEYWEKAQEVRKRSQELIDYIESVQLEVVARSEKKSKEEVLQRYYAHVQLPDFMNPGQMKEKSFLDLSKVEARDKYDEATNYLIGQNKNGEAYKLAAKMEEYRQFILSIVGQDAANRIGLNTTKEYKSNDEAKRTGCITIFTAPSLLPTSPF